MSSYRFVLVEEREPGAIVVYRRPSRRRHPGRQYVGRSSLAEALRTLRLQNAGAHGFVVPHTHPLAFLMDSVSDPVVLRDSRGRVLYANRSAQRAGSLPTRAHRRMEIQEGGQIFVLEVYVGAGV